MFYRFPFFHLSTAHSIKEAFNKLGNAEEQELESYTNNGNFSKSIQYFLPPKCIFFGQKKCTVSGSQYQYYLTLAELASEMFHVHV